MAGKILVAVSAYQTVAARWEGGRLVSTMRLPADETGWSEFNRLLGNAPDTPVYVMANAVEEDYRQETVPHVSGSARDELLKRRLSQLFRNTPYQAAIFQGRQKDKRRDDIFLFVGLNNPDLVKPWVELIESRGAPLAGVYLMSMVGQALPARLKLKEPAVLLVYPTGAGLRQAFFLDGKLRLSRLVADALIGGASPMAYAGEVAKSRLYLANFKLFPREDRLPVLVLDPNESLTDLAEALRGETGFEPQYLGRAELQKRLGLHPSTLDSGPDGLMMGLLASAPPAQSLAPAKLSSGFRTYMARRVLWTLSAAAAIACVGWSGFNLYQVRQMGAEAESLRTQARDFERRYAEVARTFPKVPTSADNLRLAVALEERLRAARRGPEGLFDILSKALTDAPTIQVERVAWKATLAGGSAGGPAGGAPGRGVPPPPGAPTLPTQTGSIEGQVSVVDENYREALERVEEFAARLRGDPRVAQVSITELPLNVSPSTSLSGSTTDVRAVKSGDGRFKMSLVLREAKP